MVRSSRSAVVVCAALSLAGGLAQAAPAGPKAPTLVAGAVEDRAGVRVAGPKGAEWALPGGPRVVAAPGSEVVVIGKAQPLTLPRKGAVAGYTVSVKRGSVTVSVPAHATSAVVLAAPRTVTAIVQSGAARAVADEKQTVVANDAGTTLIVGTGIRSLSPGRVLVAATGSSEIRDLPRAPTGVSGRRLLVAPLGSVRPAKWTWAPVPGAVAYRVAVTRKGAEPVPTDSTAPFAALPRPEPGEYLLEVRSVDATGLVSASAFTAPVRFVGLRLPAGAKLDAGRVRLDGAEKVGLVGAKGLEVRFGSSQRGVPAPPELGLYRGRDTELRLRAPDGEETAPLTLTPGVAGASIQFFPRAPTWAEATSGRAPRCAPG
jgi:hypothetical protein